MVGWAFFISSLSICRPSTAGGHESQCRFLGGRQAPKSDKPDERKSGKDRCPLNHLPPFLIRMPLVSASEGTNPLAGFRQFFASEHGERELP